MFECCLPPGNQMQFEVYIIGQILLAIKNTEGHFEF